MTDVGQLLQMMQIWTSIYHPQTDGLVEYFSQNLKRMQWRVIDMEGRNRDLLPLYVLLAVKEMPQDNTVWSSYPSSSCLGDNPRACLM